jgi:hypothetical protein
MREGKYAIVSYLMNRKIKIDCGAASPHMNDKMLKNTDSCWDRVTRRHFPTFHAGKLREEETQKTWKLLVEKE